MSQTQKQYHRFGFAERMEHFFMLLSFTLLALTGLPQKYPDNASRGCCWWGWVGWKTPDPSITSPPS